MIEAIAILVAVLALLGLTLVYGELKEVKGRLAALPQPPSKQGEDKFVEEEDAWPPDIRNALASYPAELAEPTRMWIRQQRRFRVDWAVIRRKVLSNPDNERENNWSVDAGG